MSDKYEIIYLNPKDLKDYPNNNKIHSEAQIKNLADVIDEVGFDVPIVLDEDQVIIKGHGRKYAAIYKNRPTVPCIIRDDMTDEQKRLARIADNKIAENSEWDFNNLRMEINFLQEMEIDLALTGFNATDIMLITDNNENFSFNSALSDDDESAKEKSNIEGTKEGRSYLCEIAFDTKEGAESFLQNIGVADWEFKGLTKLVDGNKLILE